MFLQKQNLFLDFLKMLRDGDFDNFETVKDSDKMKVAIEQLTASDDLAFFAYTMRDFHNLFLQNAFCVFDLSSFDLPRKSIEFARDYNIKLAVPKSSKLWLACTILDIPFFVTDTVFGETLILLLDYSSNDAEKIKVTDRVKKRL